MGTKHNFGELTADDIDKLRSIVYRKTSAFLSKEDREDIVSHILEDAVNASLKSGEPIKVAVFSLATKYTSYYVRPLDAVMEVERNRYSTEVLGHDEEGGEVTAAEPANPVDFTDSVTVNQMIDQLPPVAQLVLVAADMEHDTVVEIAADLDIPRATVHRRLKEARALMADLWMAS